jgi:hypothetical protein
MIPIMPKIRATIPPNNAAILPSLPIFLLDLVKL